MQLAYIAQIADIGVMRFIFTASLYQAIIFHERAEIHLPPTPLTLKLRDGTTFEIAEFHVEQLPNGWVVACLGPFDFTDATAIEAIERP